MHCDFLSVTSLLFFGTTFAYFQPLPSIDLASQFVTLSSVTLYLAIVSSPLTYDRLPPLINWTVSHPLYRSRICAEVFVPDGPPPLYVSIPVRFASTRTDKYYGLCQRVYESFDRFLWYTSSPWFFRAIDDTWISPSNILALIDKLEIFIDPKTDIVMKACKTRHQLFECASWTDGGVGWLLSRAAVKHAVAYDFVGICRFALWNQDDTTMGLILCHTFPDHRFWDSNFLPGNPGIGNFSSHDCRYSVVFNENTPNCSTEWLWPVRTLISLHTGGRPEIQAFLREAENAPADLAFELTQDAWRLCRADSGRLAGLVSIENLRKWTPIIKFTKAPRWMPWRGPKTFTYGGPFECQQCTGLRATSEEAEMLRLDAWNRAKRVPSPSPWPTPRFSYDGG
jgi:hypothetical protein